MSRPFDVPILILGYNRPEPLQKLILSLLPFRPKRLWVALDGPKSSKSDTELVAQSKLVIERNIDWDCTVETLFRESNLGCRIGVSSAITWFFDCVEEGIILEDDCLPGAETLDFFAEMLDRYRTSEKIMSISGDNSLNLNSVLQHSYFFQGFPMIWGWASWKSAWEKNDLQMTEWKKAKSSGLTRDFFPDRQSHKFFGPLFDRVSGENPHDSWAWGWAAAHFAHGGLSVQPYANLITNIGFGPDATHTRKNNVRSNFPTQTIFPLVHPKSIKWRGLNRRAVYQRFAKLKNPGPYRPLSRLRPIFGRLMQRSVGK